MVESGDFGLEKREDRFPSMTEEQKKIAEENMNLVYSFIYSHNIPRDEVDEYFVYYCEAIIVYDSSMAALSTFIYHYLNNKFLRYRKQQIDTACIEEENILDFLNTPNSKLEPTNIDFKEDLRKFLTKIRNRKDKYIFLMYLNGYTYVDIAKEIGNTKQLVQQKLKPILKKARLFFQK